MLATIERRRKTRREYGLGTKIVVSLILILLGGLLGVFQKYIDGVPINSLPVLVEKLNLVNYLGGLSPYILLGSLIAIFSENPIRGGFNVLVFFLSMLTTYYLYTNYVLGFLPVRYMKFWFIMAFISFFLGALAWLAGEGGKTGIVVSSGILAVLFSQAVLITQGIHTTGGLNLLTFVLGYVLLFNKDEPSLQLILMLILAVLYQSFVPFFG